MTEPTYIHLDDPDIKVDHEGNDLTKLTLLNTGDILISKGLISGKYYYHTIDDPGVVVGPYDSLSEALGENLRYKGE